MPTYLVISHEPISVSALVGLSPVACAFPEDEPSLHPDKRIEERMIVNRIYLIIKPPFKPISVNHALSRKPHYKIGL
jgi:hypothetical protein